jgi:glutamate synthase (NADPH/NADH) small chain
MLAKRHAMPVLDAAERAKTFDEVSLGFDFETARSEAERCLNCPSAPCKNGCPVGVDIPLFLSRLAKGGVLEAGAVIKKSNGLPAVCGRVCPQENQCEGLCTLGKTGSGAVAIGGCERFVGDYLLSNRQAGAIKAGRKNLCAAVVGSGPAGLSCAAELASAGVSVTVLEAFHDLGGVLRYGIPEFRLPKAVVTKEIDGLKKIGVEFKLNTVVGKTVTLDELRDNYDCVFIGSGAGLPAFMGIEGENLNGVYSANEYLTRVNLMGAYKDGAVTPVYRGKRVTVVGAGNVAMDAARTALRLGADSVKVVYRRTMAEMPARAEEIRHALEEGVVFCLLTNPKRVLGKNGFVCGLECVKTELAEPDSSGRRASKEIRGSEFIIDTDLFIVALGTSPNPLLKQSADELKTDKNGIITVDKDMRTSIDGIYAGGDAVTGAATVIVAMGQGRAAAKSMLARLNSG